MDLITGERLSDLVKKNEIVLNAKLESCEGIKYDLRISDRLLSGDYSSGVSISHLDYKEQSQLCVEPGELVFLLTEEIIRLPEDMIAMITFKRKMNHEGVLVLGGSVVDPLYNGRLLFGLYNFSSEPFPVKPGKKITSIMFYQLGEKEIAKFPKPEVRIDEFPDELLRNMTKYKPTGQQQLKQQMKEIKDNLDKLQDEFKKNERWIERFENIVNKQSENVLKNADQIDKLRESLVEESKNRKVAQKDFETSTRDKLEKTNNLVIYIKVFLTVAGTVMLAAGIKYLCFN